MKSVLLKGVMAALILALLISAISCAKEGNEPLTGTATATPIATPPPTVAPTSTPTPIPTPSPTPTPMPATFQVSGLQFVPLQEGCYGVSAIISNIGDESGTYLFQVNIDNEPIKVFQFELDGVKYKNPESENSLVSVDLDAKETRTFTESISTSVQIMYLKYQDEFGYHTFQLDNQEKEFRIDEEIKGTGDYVTQPVYLPGGLTVITLYHWGHSNFIVHLLDSKGQSIDLLVNEIGTYHGTVSVTLSPGSYRLDIKADGSWAIYYSYVQ